MIINENSNFFNKFRQVSSLHLFQFQIIIKIIYNIFYALIFQAVRFLDTRISVTSNGELQVRDVSDVDRTSAYRCVTKNILTLDEMTSPPAYIHVYGESKFLDVFLEFWYT